MKKLFTYAVGYLVVIPFIPQRVKDLLMWPLATRVLGRTYTEQVALKDGFRMIGSMEDILSRQILFASRRVQRLWEPKTAVLLERLSRHSRNILIAGSHVGYLVLLAAKHTDGTVHAFEPVPALYNRSAENFVLNPELNAKINLTQAALGEAEGKVDLYVEDIRSSAIPYSGGHLQHHNIISVPLTTIDIYAKSHDIVFDLILLDIEGFEWFALNGASKALRHKPHLILEISPKILVHTKITAEMLLGRLADLGYIVTYLDRDKDYANIYASPV